MKRVALYVLASAIALAFVYPFVWMIVNAFRTQEAILSAPLRLWPESLDLDAFRVGVTVLHPAYGAGRILAIEGEGDGRKGRVAFATVGEKTFILAKAPLRIAGPG